VTFPGNCVALPVNEPEVANLNSALHFDEPVDDVFGLGPLRFQEVAVDRTIERPEIGKTRLFTQLSSMLQNLFTSSMTLGATNKLGFCFPLASHFQPS